MKMIAFELAVTKEKLYLYFVGVLPIAFAVAYGYTRSALFLGVASIHILSIFLCIKRWRYDII